MWKLINFQVDPAITWQLINLQVDSAITWQLIQPPGKPGHHVTPNKPSGKPGHHVTPNKPSGKPGHHVAPNKPPGEPDHHVATNTIIPLLTCTFPTIPYQSHSTKSQGPFFKTIVFQGGLQPQSMYPKYSNITDSSTNSVQLPNS